MICIDVLVKKELRRGGRIKKGEEGEEVLRPSNLWYVIP